MTYKKLKSSVNSASVFLHSTCEVTIGFPVSQAGNSVSNVVFIVGKRVRGLKDTRKQN